MSIETSVNFASEIIRRINLDCDRTLIKGETIHFCFDSEDKWENIFQKLVGVRDAVVRAYMMGFREYVFVRHDGLEFPSCYRCWIPRDRSHLRGRSR
jgi:hypothetical protein